MSSRIHVVCIGGGHCNVQVLKHLRKTFDDSIQLTIVTDTPNQYIYGMIAGAVSQFYTDDEIKIQLEPLAQWCKAKYILQKVKRIIGHENKVELADGTIIDYDLLSVNVGSRARGSIDIKGV